ncbi:AAA family ATPase [Methanolacinia paynteri]|uniref:AAA family ATPase n=1 Tax=Methanolacinia paynteri TaxID=230356 RepID=UPI00064FDF5F|nr:AAA family ATPase [Methanolacinia paynteri]
MLWIEKYRPTKFSEIKGQDEVIGHLEGFVASSKLPHLLLFGPHGTGKSCALECLARGIYGEYSADNLTIIESGALFRHGKSWLENMDKFSHLYKKDESVLSNFKRIVRWYASMKPFNAEFKIIAFEEAHLLPFDAQAALRRIMEKYSATCRFVLMTQQQTSVIPAIASRCLPLFFRPLDNEEIISVLKEISYDAGAGFAISEEDLEFIAGSAKGDCRKAVTYLQLFVMKGGSLDLADISGSETEMIARSLFSAMKDRNFQKAKESAEMLMIEYGLSGSEVISEISKVANLEYNDKRIAIALADADIRLCHAGNEFVQVNAALAEIIAEVSFE